MANLTERIKFTYNGKNYALEYTRVLLRRWNKRDLLRQRFWKNR